MNLHEDTPENIDEIIFRFLEGTDSEEDADILVNWLKSHPDHQVYFDQLNSTYQTSVTLHRYSPEKTNEAWNDLSTKITSGTSERKAPRIPQWSANMLLRMAASVCLIAVSWYVVTISTRQTFPVPLTQIKNADAANTRVVLPDSSIVLLNANSTLQYPSLFGADSRDVVLKGEAFFDVRKGKIPFRVRAGNALIEVKGTRFNVEAYKKDGMVRTTLEEGKVDLSISGGKRAYSLMPGDQAIHDGGKNEVLIKQVNPSFYTAWKEERLVFDNTSLEEIVAKLQNRFRVNIEVENPLLNSEKLTMTIERETLDEILDLIMLSSDLQVKRQGDTITLYR